MNQVFEVIVVWKPSQKELDEGKQLTILQGPKCYVAKDATAASVKALREVDGDIDQLEVLVRPFL